MSVVAFRFAVEGWLREVLQRATINDVELSRYRVWVEDSAASSHSESVVTARWSWRSLHNVDSGIKWEAVTEAAPSWPKLNEHTDKLLGSLGSGGLMKTDLASLLLPLMPEPSFDNGSRSIIIPELKDAEFDRAFARFQDFIESDSIAYLQTVVLPGLVISQDLLPLQLAKDVFIERLDPKEVHDLGEWGILKPLLGPMKHFEFPGRPPLALRARYSFPKILSHGDFNLGDHTSEITEAAKERERISQLILHALALTKFGTVSLGGGTFFATSWQLGATSIIPGAVNQGELGLMDSKRMTLERADCVTLQRVFLALRSRRNDSDAVGIAIRRLTWSMENQRDEDRLLDDMIAAEALLGDKDAKTEIRYKLALRAAYEVEPDNPSRRRVVFENMKRAYDVRSAVVHGSSPKSRCLKIGDEQVALPLFVKQIEEYIRRILRKRVLGEVNALNWDDRIVGRQPPPKQL